MFISLFINYLSISFLFFSIIIPPTEGPGRGGRGFTRDPSQLQGTILQTALRKSPQGFGFTIIGGDRPDEFLQVKNVLPDGPAAHDNKIASGNCHLIKLPVIKASSLRRRRERREKRNHSPESQSHKNTV